MEEKINLCFIRLIGEENDGYYLNYIELVK